MSIKRKVLSDAINAAIVLTQQKQVLNEPSGDDLIVWPDGTTCYRSELSEFGYMSDDYEVIPYGTERYHALTKDLV